MNKPQRDALYWVVDVAIDTFRENADGMDRKDALGEEQDLLVLLDLLDEHGKDTAAMRGRMPDLEGMK